MSERVVHGGVTNTELANAASRGITLCDLSASLDPYGPHPRVVAAAANAVVSRYPEPGAAAVRAAYATAHGLDKSHVLAGNGSSELIYLVAATFADGRMCMVAGPTFGEYAAAAHAVEARVDEVAWFGPTANEPDIRVLIERAGQVRPALTFLCNPNNPTGHLLAASDIERLTAVVAGSGGRLVVDEAYMDFAWPADESVGPAPGRLVLRSLTKIHAIPGLRAGFLLGEPDDIERVTKRQPPWSLGAPAAAAVLQALEEEAFAAESRQKVAATRMALCEELLGTGFGVSPSRANFVLVDVGDAAAFRSRLLTRGFVVRDCTSFGLPRHVRIAIPHEDQFPRLLAAMKEARLE